jgi:hypothetical protein
MSFRLLLLLLATHLGFCVDNVGLGPVPVTATTITGTVPAANGGTGVANTGTLTNASNTTITGGGTLALGGFTLTAPATGTVGLLGTAGTWSAVQTLQLPLIADASDATKSIGFTLSGATAGAKLTIVSSQTTNRTLNIPVLAGTDTVVTLASANAFTGANSYTGVQTITNATAASSTSTAALVVTGGIGTAGSLYCNGATAAGTQEAVYIQGTSTIVGGVTDAYTCTLRLRPTYNAATALTVTRHNYISLNDVVLGGVGPAALTDACVFRFDTAVGTHKALDAASTKTTPGTVNGWLKVNVAGTLYYIPMYTSKTSMLMPCERIRYETAVAA